jgi:hypothetical protein
VGAGKSATGAQVPAVRLFVFVVVVLLAIWLAASHNFNAAYWFLVAFGVCYWVISTLWEAFSRLVGWINAPRKMEITIYDQEREEIVDAEVVEETNVKWWRGG